MNENGKGRILLHGRRALGKGGDFITRNQCKEMITAECAKVHEHYLTQIPKFTAQMIQDALVGYGLLVVQPATDAPAVPENAEGEGRTLEEVVANKEIAETYAKMPQVEAPSTEPAA